MRNAYPVYIGHRREPALNQPEPQLELPADEAAVNMEIQPAIEIAMNDERPQAELPADEVAVNMQVNPQIEVAINEPQAAEPIADMLGAAVMDIEVAQEVEVPYEVDRELQIHDDFQLANDLQTAEMHQLEMTYEEEPRQPRPKRIKRSPVPLIYIVLHCVGCGKEFRRSDIPPEVAAEFICSEKCIPGAENIL